MYSNSASKKIINSKLFKSKDYHRITSLFIREELQALRETLNDPLKLSLNPYL